MSVADREKPMPCVECYESDGSVTEMQRVPPASVSVSVTDGTPKFYYH